MKYRDADKVGRYPRAFEVIAISRYTEVSVRRNQLDSLATGINRVSSFEI